MVMILQHANIPKSAVLESPMHSRFEERRNATSMGQTPLNPPKMNLKWTLHERQMNSKWTLHEPQTTTKKCSQSSLKPDSTEVETPRALCSDRSSPASSTIELEDECAALKSLLAQKDLKTTELQENLRISCY